MKEASSFIPHYIMLGIFFLAGATCFLASLSNAKWFLNSRNIGFLRKYIPPTGIRIIYIFIGAILMVLALYFYYNLRNIQFEQGLI